MKAAIIYTSVTGNTKYLMQDILSYFEKNNHMVDVYEVSEFPLQQLSSYDLVMIGTYSWDDGDIPLEMEDVYEAFEQQQTNHIVTGVFGTGDRFYPYFCGAVDLFRDMLYVHTSLAVTLKVELLPQESDLPRCEKFYQLIIERMLKHSNGSQLQI